MIVHIVMLSFNEENKEANIIQIKQMLENLMGVVPSLKSMDVGVNFLEEDRAMDLSLIATFEGIDGLKAYAVHPEHKKVVEFIKSVVKEAKSVDYTKE